MAVGETHPLKKSGQLLDNKDDLLDDVIFTQSSFHLQGETKKSSEMKKTNNVQQSEDDVENKIKSTEEWKAEMQILKSQFRESEEELQKEVRRTMHLEDKQEQDVQEYNKLKDDLKKETKRRIKLENEVHILKAIIEEKSAELITQEREFLEKNVNLRQEVKAVIDEQVKEKMQEIIGAEIAKRGENMLKKENRGETGKFELIEKIENENDRQVVAREIEQRIKKARQAREEDPKRKYKSLINEIVKGALVEDESIGSSSEEDEEVEAKKKKTRGGKNKRIRDEIYSSKYTTNNNQQGDFHDGNGRSYTYEKRNENQRVYPYDKRTDNSRGYSYQRRNDNYQQYKKQSPAVLHNREYAYIAAHGSSNNNR